MPRPTDKNALLKAQQEEYNKLIHMITSLSEAEQEGIFPFEDRDRNIRDVLTHLYEWHLMFLKWYEEGMAGKTPEMPAPGYTWKETPALNKAIWEKYQNTSLKEAKSLLAGTHKKITEITNSHTNEELFEKNKYKWTKTSSLGSYLISATSSHYDWGQKKIKKYVKAMKYSKFHMKK